MIKHNLLNSLKIRWRGEMSREEVIQPKDWREARRFRAWELKQKGWRQRDIAEALGVSDGAISQWLKGVRQEGIGALRGRRGGGPKQRLKDEQLAQLPALLAQGPQHFGFSEGSWTHAKIAAAIRQQFGVSYTPTHVGRILRKLNWKPESDGDPVAYRGSNRGDKS